MRVIALLETLARLYPKISRDYLRIFRLVETARSVDGFRSCLGLEDNGSEHNADRFNSILGPLKPGKQAVCRIQVAQQDDWWLHKLGYQDVFPKLERSLRQVRAEIDARNRGSASILDGFI
jgi:hypothetical protein